MKFTANNAFFLIFRELIAYEEFCDDLEKASAGTLGSSRRHTITGPERVSYGSSFKKVAGTGAPLSRSRGAGFKLDSVRDDESELDDGAFAHRNVERWYTREASPKQRREFDNVFDSLQQFKLTNSVDHDFNPRRKGIVPGVEVVDDEFGPRTSDSVIRLSGTRSGAHSPGRGRDRYARYGTNSLSYESPRIGESTR